ncbi:MAG: alpha/beta fold hydrolase [Candidatus Competibacteraceae bacterium]|nr:alpha/beta fold hydrolase [Candidatus Competibacteraceae bacterium]
MTLVLLPGLDGTGLLFEPLVNAVGDNFEVRIVSYPHDGALGYAELELVARNALPCDGPYVLLGESFSGPIAVSIAASNPAGLLGVVLSCSFVRNPRPVLSAFRFLVDAFPVRFMPAFLLSFLLMGRFSTDNLQSRLKQALSSVSATALRTRLQAVLSVDVSTELQELRVPLMYLRATEDQIVPHAASSQIAAIYPMAEVLTLEGPHCLLQAAPVEAAKVIGSFAARVQNAF